MGRDPDDGLRAEDPLHPPVPQTPPVPPAPEQVVLVTETGTTADEPIRVVGSDGIERIVVLPPAAPRRGGDRTGGLRSAGTDRSR